MKIKKAGIGLSMTIPTENYSNVKPSVYLELEVDEADEEGMQKAMDELYDLAESELGNVAAKLLDYQSSLTDPERS